MTKIVNSLQRSYGDWILYPVALILLPSILWRKYRGK